MQMAVLVPFAIAKTQPALSANPWLLHPSMSAFLPNSASSAVLSLTTSRLIAILPKAKAKVRQAKEEGLNTKARVKAKAKARNPTIPTTSMNHMTPMTPTKRFPSKHHRIQWHALCNGWWDLGSNPM